MAKAFKLILLGVFLGIIGYAFYFHLNKNTLSIHTPHGIVKYKIELALTPEQQKLGLMYREKLDSSHGMLFLFTPPRVTYMWMKDTLIPLDMVFFNSKGEVVRIHENAKPKDTTIIPSYFPVAGVLEINAGDIRKFGIDTHSRLDLTNVH